MQGNRIKMLITVLCAAFAVSACSKEGAANSTPVSSDISYTVISAGTEASEDTSETEDIYADISDTELVIPDGMVTKYASLDYNERMQDVYDDVVDTMKSFSEKSYVPLTISTEDYVKVLETVRCEQLYLFYLENRYAGDFDSTAQTYEMNFFYKYSIKEVNIMLAESEKAAQEIIAMTDSSMSDYEKLKIFHDYLVLNVESTTDDPTADSIYGALVNKKALCEGYAKAFSYLCNLAGIENMIVTGFTDVDHMWNMVKLDGKWYHVDVGWDKPTAALSRRYPDMVLYQYFLAEDSVMENNRIISNMFCEPPVADSSDMYYFNVENKYAETYEQALEIIEEACRSCIDSGEKYFMIKLDSSNLYLQTTSDLITPDIDGVTDIDRIVSSIGFTGRISYIDYYKAYRIIIFVLE